MQLTFESLTELKDFMGWIGDLTHPRQAVEAAPKATIVVHDLPIDGEAADEVIATPASQAEQIANNPAELRRKRRTKAEMEAARAAAPDLKDELQASVAATLEQAGETPEAAAEMAAVAVAAPVDKGDAVEFIKSRLAERPEVSQVEHLNLARTFIGKHGMEKYNASFPLAGLTPNVMGYSPADCATHAAALDFLSLE